MTTTSLPTFTKEEFLTAVQCGETASSPSAPGNVHALPICKVELPDGTAYALANTQVTRFCVAVNVHFRGNFRRTCSFLLRYWALADLLAKGHLEEFRRIDSEGFQEIYEAVYVVAGTLPLGREAKFDAKTFREALARECDEGLYAG
jgi:hypothetical protein